MHARVEPSNVAPAWLLFLWRLAKANGGDLAIAWRDLPQHLPATVYLPTIDEAAIVLVDFNLH